MKARYNSLNREAPLAFKASEIRHFFGILMHMGIVRLPAKRSYWSKTAGMPIHSVTRGMSCNRFDLLWRNLHLEPDSNSGSDSDSDSEDQPVVWFQK